MPKAFRIEGIEDFEKAVSGILKENEAVQVNILRKLSMDGLRSLQMATPRDTGRAASSWNVTVDTQPSDWKPQPGQSYYPLPASTYQPQVTPYSYINISSNLEYMVALEHGHSKQRKYFIRDTIAGLTEQLTSQTKKESERVVK